jgi:hypothetical protein
MAEKNKKKVEEEGQTPAASTLQTKSAVMSGILQAINAMNHEQMMQWFAGSQELAQTIGGDQAAQNAGTVQMKPSDAAVHFGGMREDFQNIISGDDLNEELKERLTVLFENAVNVRVSLVQAELEEQVEAKVSERTEALREEITEKVDQYVTYAAEQWVEKNEVAIESTLKVERAEKLFQGLTKLMAECAVELPEEKVDVVEELTKKVEELEAKLNEQVDETIAYKEQFEAVQALRVFDEVSEGLPLTDVEKFKKLVEDVEITSDAVDLKKKLSIIREAHFPKDGARRTGKEGLTEAQEVAPVEPAKTPLNEDRLSAYLSRASNRRYGAL